MAERKVRSNEFVEFGKWWFGSPVSYVRELRHRPIDMGDKILMGLVATSVGINFIAAHDPEGKFSLGYFLIFNALFYGMGAVGMQLGNIGLEKSNLEKAAKEQQERRQFYIDSMNA